jgi:hypothetical protein
MYSSVKTHQLNLTHESQELILQLFLPTTNTKLDFILTPYIHIFHSL